MPIKKHILIKKNFCYIDDHLCSKGSFLLESAMADIEISLVIGVK